MTRWLQTFVKVNPVSHLVSAMRDLAARGLVVVAIFAPLSVRSCKRHL
jgi:ABC-2 type transport system permease protein